MNKITTLGTALLLSGVSTLALAASNPISVHVLDTQSGTPSAGVEVTLEHRTDSGWETLASDTTGDDGRISALYPDAQPFDSGVYRAVFETGDWFEAKGTETFFPQITIPFEVTDTEQHYHIPLLLSPYAYSTYRGS